MQSIKITAHVGEDGILKLEVPVGKPNVDCEVTVNVPEVNEQRREWEAFVNEMYGALADDPIERGDQGIPETRDAIL